MGTQKRVGVLTLLVFFLLYSNTFALTISYQYDDLYRLTAEIRSDGKVTTYQYDSAGNRLSRITTGLITGDLNGDSFINAADVIMSLQIISGITPKSTFFLGAEVGGDQKVGLPEALYILQKAAGLQ